ncbi:IclR family transcriptional regulator [Microbacterium sp. TWP3-1-2b2]|uniref:IclR family transcriptional regulator n=1 Tax=Microbacterium sp. TWP3-1-2b2 TaxID=2804651 RepID=UPI003CEB62C9
MSQSVERAAAILDSLAEEPKAVSPLAVEFGIHRSTMFRELQTLQKVGFVRRREDGTYAVAFRLAVLGAAALEDVALKEAAHVPVRQLHRVVGNTVHVAGLVGDEIFYVDKVEDPRRVRLYSRIGSPVHPNRSAVGKAILAGLPQKRRDDVLAGADWTRHTAQTLTTRAELDAELEKTSVRGWAVDQGEFEEIVNCVAVPITTPAGVVGAVSITALRMIHDLTYLEGHIPLLKQTADQIAHALR